MKVQTVVDVDLKEIKEAIVERAKAAAKISGSNSNTVEFSYSNSKDSLGELTGAVVSFQGVANAK